jgi:hypothetical protein
MLHNLNNIKNTHKNISKWQCSENCISFSVII